MKRMQLKKLTAIIMFLCMVLMVPALSNAGKGEGPKLIGQTSIKGNREVLLNPSGPKLIDQAGIRVNREVLLNPRGSGAGDKRILQNSSIDSLDLSGTMEAGASKITGRVFGPNCTTPLENIFVSAYRWEGDGYRRMDSVPTAADGTYEIGSLPAGTYKVQFYDGTGNYTEEYYDNQGYITFAQTIVLGAEATVADINACLETGSKITGRVFGPDCTTPLAGINVAAYRWDGRYGSYCGDAYTASDGTYTLGGLAAGTYKVRFQDWNGTYAGEYYDNQLDIGPAQAIVVGTASTAADINACLGVPSKITGTVFGPDCTTPLGGFGVYAYRWNGNYYQGVRGSTTAAEGTYEINGLSAGTYKVKFYDGTGAGNYLEQYYDNQAYIDSAQTIVVGVESTVGDINACIKTPSKITGRVFGPDCTTPLAGIHVSAYVVNGMYSADAYTADDGTYEIGGLAAGTYKVRFRADDGNYLDQYYDNQPYFDSGHEIVVGVESTVADINACLEAPSKITGTVFGPECITPLENISVYLYRWNGDYFELGQSAYTAADGTYEIGGLAAGTYRVEFNDYTCNYVVQYYDNQPYFDSAREIVLGVASTVADINACLEAPSKITGTVFGPDCITPLENISVYLYRWNGDYYELGQSAYTAADGTYEIGGLAAGTYRVEFYNEAGFYFIQYYDNQTDFDSAREIAVDADSTVGDINACLAANLQGACSGDADCDSGTTCHNGRCVECLLGNSLDADALTLETTSGLTGWYCQKEEFYYGDSAAQSGAIYHLGLSPLSTTVTGPTVVSFYWKVSSEIGYDYLTFYIDDAEMDSISGEVDWQSMEYDVPAGTHTLKWQYSKDGSAESGLDCGWVDRLRPECVTDGNCDDAAFCNGADACVDGMCVAGILPCSGATPVCDENSDVCVECLVNDDCSAGSECVDGSCVPVEDTDTDLDGFVDGEDNCPSICNPQQKDADSDGIGDVCDTTPGCGGCGQTACEVQGNCDSDSDGIANGVDNCPAACNTQQKDADGDGIGDVCDTAPGCGGCGQPVCEVVCTP